MHPIEHLRHVARARGADPASLVREAATALGSLRADRANLVIACRRIVERHPEAGPLWAMCARLLTADDPARLAWQIAEEADDDPTSRSLARAFGDDSTLLTIGWPTVVGEAVVRRGNVSVLCADSGHEASSFMQRLERFDVDCEPIPAEALARAARAADVAVVEARAACPDGVLAPLGAHVVAAVAASVETPVWLVVPTGTRLPGEYVDAIRARCSETGSWHGAVDDLPVELVTHVVTADGVTVRSAESLRPECPFAPELLRPSPF